jgi:CelD/BcsL family acetyltransferase involved in cellulose biosynthesis
MKTVIYKSIDKSIINEWEKFWKESSFANYANSPSWFVSVIETFSYADFAIVAVYKNEKLVAIGGLVKEKKYGITVYTAAPNDFICGIPFLFDHADNAVASALKQVLASLGIIFLSNIPEVFVSVANKNKLFTESFVQTVNYYLPLQKDEAGKAHITKRRKMLREIRGIEDQFIVKSFAGNAYDALSIVFSLDKQTSKQQKAANTFASADIQHLYLSLANHFRDSMRINILYYQNMPIAYEIGFMVGKTYYGSQIAYLSDYRHYSPGKVLLVNLLDSLVAKNVTMMDFGSGESPMKQLFTDEKRTLYSVIISSNKGVSSYLKMLFILKNYAFASLENHKKIYGFYKKLKK